MLPVKPNLSNKLLQMFVAQNSEENESFPLKIGEVALE